MSPTDISLKRLFKVFNEFISFVFRYTNIPSHKIKGPPGGTFKGNADHLVHFSFIDKRCRYAKYSVLFTHKKHLWKFE